MSKKSHRVLAIVVAFMMTVSSVLPANASIQGVSEKSETAIEILEPLIVDDGQDQIPSDLPENTEDEVNTVTETEKLPMDVEETTPENEVESASEETMLEDDSDRTQSELKNPPLSDQLEGAEDEVNSEAETAKTPVNIEEIREETTPDNESEGTSEETILEDDNSNIQSDPMKNVDNDTNLETKSEELQTEARENRSDSEAEVGFRVKAPKYNLNDVSEENEEDENKDKDKEEELTERSFIVVVKYEGSELGSGSEIKNRPKEMELSLQKKLDGEENWTDIGNYVIQSSDLIEESEVQWKKTIASKLQTYEMVTEEGEEVKKAISYRVVGVNTNEYYILRDSDPVVDSDSKNWIQNLTMTYYAPQSFEVEVDFEGEQINSETERSARPKSLNLTLQSRNSESETWKNVREYKIADINLDPNQSEDNKIVWKKEIAKDLPSKVQVAEEVKDISYRVVLNYETDQYKVSVEEPSTEIKDTVFTTSQKITLEYQNPGSFDVTIHFAGDHIGEDAEVSVRPNSIPLVLQRAISTEEGEENWINIGEYTISSSDKIQDDNSVTWKKTIAHNLPEKITVNGEEKNVIYRVICSDIPSNYKIIADERNGSSQEITLNYRDTLTFDARVVLYGADLGSEDEKAERPETIVATLQSTTADAPFAENTTAIWNDVKSVTLKLPTKDQTPQGEGTGIYLDCVTPINNLPTTATVDGEEKQLHYRVVYENAYPKYEASNGIPSETRDESENIKTVSQDISMTYQSSWNYKIDLVWSVNNKGSNEHIEERNLAQTKNKPIALLTASAQKNYQAEQLEIRLPRYLYPEDKTGKIYLVGIGDEENPTEEESFTYRYDTKGTSDETDDEIVFYNYKDFNAGNNFNVQIGYEVEPLKVTDCATGTLIAKGTGQYGDMSHDIEKQSNPEKLNSREITYWYDTGAKFKNSEKTRYTGGSSIYYQGDERNDGVGANFGNYEYDPDNYNYVYFDIGTDYYNSTNAITYNQYYDLTWELDFGTETGAEVVAVNKGTLEGVEGEKGKYTVTINKKNNSDSGVAQYVLVRYPRIQTGTNESGQATYDAEYSMTGKINLEVQDQHDRNQEEDYDANDTDVMYVESSVRYKDYDFHYEGELFTSTKRLTSNFINAALSHIEAGRDISDTYAISAGIYGYDKLSNGFRLELDDDAVFVRATGKEGTTAWQRLTEDDYYFDTSLSTVTVSYSDINRETGNRYTKKFYSSDLFEIQVKDTVYGKWRSVTKATYEQLQSALRSEEVSGHVAFRIISPENLTGYLGITVSGFKLHAKASSPILSAWASRSNPDLDDYISGVEFVNFDAMRAYAPNQKGGEYKWINRWSSSTNTRAEETGLNQHDAEVRMDYQRRQNAGESIGRITANGNMTKSSKIYSNTLTNKRITVQNVLKAYEELPGNLGDWGSSQEDLLQKNELSEGVFYDLLPSGYEYDPTISPSVITYSGAASTSVGVVTNVEVIDDFESTGRQMVIIHVKKGYTTNEDNEEIDVDNWGEYSYYFDGANQTVHRSQFEVTFYCSANYQDTKPGVAMVNYAAFQREDGAALNSGHTSERQIGDNNITNINGERVQWNKANGWIDGTTNTRYAQDSWTAEFLSSYEAGLVKTVKGDSQKFGKVDDVTIDEDYVYRLRMGSTSKDGITKDIVIYDILENAVNAGEDGGATTEVDGWHGYLKGINLNSVIRLGIEPVVWYSTVPNLTYDMFKENLNPDSSSQQGELYLPEMQEGTVWTRTAPEDLSTVTALAFDLRKNRDGSDYELPQGTILTIDITMHAPSTLQTYEWAYNKPAYNSTFQNAEESSDFTSSFNQANRVMVHLQMPQTVEIFKYYKGEKTDVSEGEDKVNEDGEITALQGAIFRLYKCTNTDDGHTHTAELPGTSGSCYTEVARSVSDANGVVRFDKLTTGDYAIREIQAPTGWSSPKSYWVFSVNAYRRSIKDSNGNTLERYHTDPQLIRVILDANGNVTTEGGTEESQYVHEIERVDGQEDQYTLQNDRTRREIEVQKIWVGATERASEITVVLKRGIGNAFEAIREAVLDQSNKWQTKFENLFRYILGTKTEYEYAIEEKNVPSGFESVITEELTESQSHSNFAITFSKNSMTETNWDYAVILYQDPNSRTEDDAHQEKWKRSKWGLLNGNFISGRTIIVPTNEFYIAYYTDTSVSSAGFTIEKIEPTLEEFDTNKFEDAGTDPTFTGSPGAKSGSGVKIFGNNTITELDDTSELPSVTKHEHNLRLVWHYKGTSVNDKAVKIVNTRLGNVEIYKEVTGQNVPDDEFTFIASFKTKDGANITEDLTYIKHTGDIKGSNATEAILQGNESGEYSFKLKNNERFRFIDLPIDAKYTIYEAQSGRSVYYNTSASYDKDQGDGEISGIIATGSVNSYQTPVIHYRNAYEPGKVKLSFPISKIIKGNDRPEEKRTFTFELTAGNDSPMPAQTTVQITDEGKAVIGPITYEQEGTYNYTVKEKNEATAGDVYGYDAKEYQIRVEITRVNDQLVANWKLDDIKATESTVLTFTNTYRPKKTNYNLPLTKYVSGISFVNSPEQRKNRTFKIQTYGGDENTPIPTPDTIGVQVDTEIPGKSDKLKGEGHFGLEFTSAGTYSYKILEVNENATGFTYDETEYTAVITVVDNGGNLEVSNVEYVIGEDKQSEIVFNNEYHPTETQLILPVEKEIDGVRRQTERRFDFYLEASEETSDAPLPRSQRLFITGEGTNRYAPITFKEVGTYKYTLTEETENTYSGYGYDTKRYEITVDVVDRDGTLTIGTVESKEVNDSNSVTLFKEGDSDVKALTFTNTYSVTDVDVVLPTIRKVIQGHSRTDNQRKEFTFTLTSKDSAPMPEGANESTKTYTITDEGELSLGSIHYTEYGTYVYTLKEEDKGEEGYGYDPTEHTIVVTVTDTDAALHASYTVDGEPVSVEDRPNFKIDFTNQYYPGATFLAIPVVKQIDGTGRTEEKTFSFMLSSEGEDTPMPEKDILTITGEGSNQFGSIAYTEVGIYHYKVTEIAQELKGYQFDDTTYDVTVNVEDQNGKLEAKLSIANTGKSEIRFINTYTPSSAEVTLGAVKKLQGKELKALDYIFVLEDVRGNILQKVQNGASGNIEFRKISYTKAGTFHYRIYEQAGKDANTTYDDTVYTVTVEVEDRNGQLVAIPSLKNEEVVFTNVYKTPEKPTPEEPGSNDDGDGENPTPEEPGSNGDGGSNNPPSSVKKDKPKTEEPKVSTDSVEDTMTQPAEDPNAVQNAGREGNDSNVQNAGRGRAGRATGDSSNSGLYLIVILVGLAGMFVHTAVRKKKQR